MYSHSRIKDRHLFAFSKSSIPSKNQPPSFPWTHCGKCSFQCMQTCTAFSGGQPITTPSGDFPNYCWGQSPFKWTCEAKCHGITKTLDTLKFLKHVTDIMINSAMHCEHTKKVIKNFHPTGVTCVKYYQWITINECSLIHNGNMRNKKCQKCQCILLLNSLVR